jgi:hypothetical protein
LKTHKKASYGEIEMFRVAMYLVSRESGSNSSERYYSSDNTVESFNQTYTHTCILNYFMKMVVASITSVMAHSVVHRI